MGNPFQHIKMWIKWNKKGERIVYTDNGKTITEKVIGKVNIKDPNKIKKTTKK